jgi:hypothetical protein
MRWLLLIPLLFATPLLAAEEPDRTEMLLEDILAKLQQMEIRLEQIERQLEEGAPATAAAAEEEDPRFANLPNHHRERGPNIELLRVIKLPDDASRDDLAEYVQAVVNASKGQNSYSSDDPQIGMLTDVGDEHADLLLPHYDDWYVKQALQKMDVGAHKATIIELLPKNPQMASLILKHEWVEDAEAEIRTALKNMPQHQSHRELAIAGLRLDDPALADTLLGMLAQTQPYQLQSLYTEYAAATDTIPRPKLDDAIERMWINSQKQGEWGQQQAAPLAIRHGVRDALLYTAVALDGGQMVNEHQTRPAMLIALLDHIDAPGVGSSDLPTWVQDNRDTLTWDPDRRKWHAASADNAAE